ncbi:MAG: hypothetical protein IPN00_11390 [Hydrogenophilales bacterium]|nr:hypothetical protein [Hydrogenophilales bacterium]
MRIRIGRWRTDSLPFFLQVVPFGIAAQSDSNRLWLLAFTLAVLINLWAWLIALGRRRAIQDTPTSRVASAAQGYVELVGTGQPLADTQLLSPLSQLPCLWYRYTMEERDNGEWKQIEHGESDLPFMLEDGSGRCQVDPRGAEIHAAHQETRTQGDRRTTEHILLKGDSLYALGEFRSDNGEHVPLDRRRDVGELLGEWKADQTDLYGRFDLDGNGAIDAREWDLARRAAEREVEQRHREIRAQPTRHFLAKPRWGKPYLISNHPPEKLGRRYGWLIAAHFVLLTGALVGVSWALGLPD